MGDRLSKSSTDAVGTTTATINVRDGTLTMPKTSEKDWVKLFEKNEAAAWKMYKRLKEVDLFVLDNSIRESTVGQLRGHTIEDKYKIWQEAKKCGFKNWMVASFNHMTRVDDVFIGKIVEEARKEENGEEIISGFWAFSEIVDFKVSANRIPNGEILPVGLKKSQEFGLYNVLFEIDFGDKIWNFRKFPVEKFIELLDERFRWCNENLPWAKDSTDPAHQGPRPKIKIGVNFRDMPEVMSKHPERIYKVATYLASLPESSNFFAIAFEEPTGDSLPESVANWTKGFRRILDDYGSKARLLVHTHERFGLSDVTALQSIMAGADGIWASVCCEGAYIGAASSCVTLLNLIRLGNKKVLKNYNCSYLRKAAIEVTRITTGTDPPKRQPIFGTRACDIVFGTGPGDNFDFASFFGEKPPVRITTMSSADMILQRLKNLFGDEPEFTWTIAAAMKEKILDDLRDGRKEEYMSPAGFALLFDRSGGKMTESMRDVVAKQKANSAMGEKLISEIKKDWDEWDLREDGEKDNMLAFDSFYNGFMSRFFGCYRCADTLDALKCLDMDSDGEVDWDEFAVYLKWAANAFPDLKDKDELLDAAFTKGLIPAMRDERLRSTKAPSATDDVDGDGVVQTWYKLTNQSTSGVLTLDEETGNLVTASFKCGDNQLFKLVSGGRLISKTGKEVGIKEKEVKVGTELVGKDEGGDIVLMWRVEDGKIILFSYEFVLDAGDIKGKPVILGEEEKEGDTTNQEWIWTEQLM